MFDGLELLEIRIGGTLQRQVLNLSDLHRKILGFLPEEVKTLYLNPGVRKVSERAFHENQHRLAS